MKMPHSSDCFHYLLKVTILSLTCPKHYPNLIKCFGPLVHVWNMQFEAKHCFYKTAVRDSQISKNILKTLAIRHQHMMAHHLATPYVFKPEIQTFSVASVAVSTLPEVAQTHIRRQTASDSATYTSKLTIDGTDFTSGMFVSAGDRGGLPAFCKIADIYLNHNVSFLCCNYDASLVLRAVSHAEKPVYPPASWIQWSSPSICIQDKRLAAVDPKEVHSSEKELRTHLRLRTLKFSDRNLKSQWFNVISYIYSITRLYSVVSSSFEKFE